MALLSKILRTQCDTPSQPKAGVYGMPSKRSSSAKYARNTFNSCAFVNMSAGFDDPSIQTISK